MFETIDYELSRNVLTITLNRPEAMNTYTYQMNEELKAAFKQAETDDEVRVIIVTGAGRAFCAGMDLESGEETFQTAEDEDEFRDIGGQVSLQLFESSKPIIAAINGPAVGIGLTMTLPMDLRIVKKDTKIGFVFARRGIGPEAASGWFLPRIVSMGKALEWMLTGRMIPTKEALESGLVLYEEEDPLGKSKEIAEDIVTNTAATSNSFAKKLLWGMLEENHPENSHLIESKFLYWASRNRDAKEGIESFVEKRSPIFPLKHSDLPNFFSNGTEGDR
ncbi:enoyl-CoA hydratase-related protein [Halalkalibacillus halophilus]|uniref:enoyl-CoA hydratase-related protein n=1 Tax=Halalkalibacillus halophilus TaxID=392827 RepID=UPI0003FF7BA7|nr:enoyl-CoA hydratase-related protein [Halalkalibacillus halophilus]